MIGSSTEDVTLERALDAATVSHTLPNGLRIIGYHDPTMTETALGMYVGVGSRDESDKLSGVAHLVEHLLYRGCEGYPSTRLFNAAVDDLAMELVGATGREVTSFETICEPQRIEALCLLLGRMLVSPTFVLRELADHSSGGADEWDVEQISMTQLFEKTGLARPIGGVASSVRKLTVEDCRAFHRAHYHASNMVLSVAGPLPHDDLLRVASEAFALVPEGQVTHEQGPALELAVPRLILRRMSGDQVTMRLVWPTPPVGSEAWPALALVQRALDDGSSALLHRTIVDELGLAYHVSAELESLRDVGLFSIEGTVEPVNAVRFFDELMALVQGLSDTLLSGEDWQRQQVRLRMWRRLCERSPEFVAAFGGHRALTQPFAPLSEHMRRMEDIGTEEVRRTVQTLLRPERLQAVVVGDLSLQQASNLRRRFFQIKQNQIVS
jgi:predicted Zn-dependent peptidase